MSYPTTPAGWYPDPTPGTAPGTLRFWNGERWTDDVSRPAGPPATPPPSAGQGPPRFPSAFDQTPSYHDPLAPIAPPAPIYGYGYPAVPVAPRTNGSAIAALITAIAGLAVCPLISIAGIFLGHSARKQIRLSNGAETGDGLALAGIIIGWIVTVGTIIIIALIVIAFRTGP